MELGIVTNERFIVVVSQPFAFPGRHNGVATVKGCIALI